MIENWGIRSRVLLVAVLPMLVLALLLTGFYTTARLGDLEAAHSARGTAFARQLVAASEYAVFSGNREALQQLTNAILSEEGVTGVVVGGRQGVILASSGVSSQLSTAQINLENTLRIEVIGNALRIVEPIVPAQLELDEDLITVTSDQPFVDHERPLLGYVMIELSRDQLNLKRNELLRAGVITIVIVLLGTLALAFSMSRGVSGPIRQVAITVKRIGKGHFNERVPIVGGGSLRTLAHGVNDMATELSSMHADMNARIDAATAALRARKEEAEQANTSKSRFLAAASHDLRQPMHALGLFITELSQQNLDGRSRHLLEQVSASAEAMEDLLDSLLDISKLDAGVLKPNIHPFPVQPILDRIKRSLAPPAIEKGLELRVRPSKTWILSDPVLFERILSNLVSNGVRHTQSGRVLVGCRVRGAQLRIEVFDTGVGIAQEAQTIVFQEFVQLDNPARMREKGLGLGLAIVRRLTDLLDHPLYLRSLPGKGSLFAIEVPTCAPLTTAHTTTIEYRRDTGDLTGTHVAIIDDDPLALAATESLLSSWGCAVTAAADTETLIAALAEAGKPDLLISDLRLGTDLAGLEAVATVKKRFGAHLPAAVITGDTAPETLQAAQSAGLPVLHKPARPARLRALINRLARME